jgi:uncharacterized protein YcfL
MLTLKTLLSASLAFAAITLPLGCGTNTYSTRDPSANVDLVRRVVRDPGLASDVQIEAARINDANSSKVAQITVRNRSSWERRISIQFTWFDAAGAKVAGGTSWSDYTLGSGEVRDISSLGIPEAADFRVQIRAQR